MLSHKWNDIFRANWTWISDCRACSILKTVPVSQDSKEYTKCKIGEFVHNNTKPLFRIGWGFVDNFCGYSFTQCVRTIEHIKISLWAQTQQSLLLFTQGSIYNRLRFAKQISCVLRGIKWAISRKLVQISDCRVSSFLKTVPGCRVSRHSVLH